MTNRRLLSARLRHALAASKRSGCFGAVMFMDLDHFKPINDQHGHEVGDLLLLEVALRLKDCVREIDTVARFGGDEFFVMLDELSLDPETSALQAAAVAEKIRIALSAPYRLQVKVDSVNNGVIAYQCTASIGVALFCRYEGSQANILKWADTATYHAKEAGRNLVRFYTPPDATSG